MEVSSAGELVRISTLTTEAMCDVITARRLRYVTQDGTALLVRSAIDTSAAVRRAMSPYEVA